MAVMGLDYGDEGKGKFVSYLAPYFDYVVRGTGGDNAAHTSEIGTEVYKLSLIPSGVLYPHAIPVLGDMMVINPEVLLEEMGGLEKRGVSTKNVIISAYAHVIMPWHLSEDEARESSKGEKKIGTTKRGIGPAYKDMAGRYDAIRMEDLVDEERLRGRIETVFPSKTMMLELFGAKMESSKEELIQRYTEFGRRLKPFVRKNVPYILNHALDLERKTILAEGAQGALLSVVRGSYPNVTSSITTINGLCEGIGISGDRFTVLGVTKAYPTRVGGGPFPTQLGTDEQIRQEERMRREGKRIQLTDEDFERANAGDEYSIGKVLRVQGNEYGTRTGRPRRTGWFDAPSVNYSIMITGAKRLKLAVAKIDVLSGLDEIKICVAHDINGEVTTEYRPGHDLEIAKPVYETLDGWERMSKEEWMTIARGESKMPRNAQKFVNRVEELTQHPVVLLSVGPERDATIQLKDNIF